MSIVEDTLDRIRDWLVEHRPVPEHEVRAAGESLEEPLSPDEKEVLKFLDNAPCQMWCFEVEQACAPLLENKTILPTVRGLWQRGYIHYTHSPLQRGDRDLGFALVLRISDKGKQWCYQDKQVQLKTHAYSKAQRLEHDELLILNVLEHSSEFMGFLELEEACESTLKSENIHGPLHTLLERKDVVCALPPSEEDNLYPSLVLIVTPQGRALLRSKETEQAQADCDPFPDAYDRPKLHAYSEREREETAVLGAALLSVQQLLIVQLTAENLRDPGTVREIVQAVQDILDSAEDEVFEYSC